MPEPVINYTWRIEQLDAAPADGGLQNIVRRVHWRLFATDGMNSVDAYGDVCLADPASNDFTPFSKLSETTVTDWLEAAIDARAGEEEPTVEQLRAGLAGMLAAKRKPAIVAMDAPWSTS